MKTLPEGLIDLGACMSNFDHAFESDKLDKVKAGGHSCGYAGWEFWGDVWYEDGKFHCQVKRYHQHIDTITAPTPAELMVNVSDKYGYE